MGHMRRRRDNAPNNGGYENAPKGAANFFVHDVAQYAIVAVLQCWSVPYLTPSLPTAGRRVKGPLKFASGVSVSVPSGFRLTTPPGKTTGLPIEMG